MERELVEIFKGKPVKIKYYNGFGLKGTILKVYRTSLLFQTNQATSAIALTEIKSIVECDY
jgi:hypothetical protein